MIKKTSRESLNEEDADPVEDYDDDVNRDSVFEIDTTVTSFWGRIRILCNNSCFMYLVAAGFFRFFGGYSLGFLSGSFYENRWPE